MVNRTEKQQRHYEANKRWKKRNKKKLHAWRLEYYKNHKKQELDRKGRRDDFVRFGGLKDNVLKRDNHACRKCGISEQKHIELYGLEIGVHHKDLNKKNNTMRNLFTICCSCHGKLHSLKRKVRCIDTGEVFESISEASRSMGVSISSIWSVCRGVEKTAGGLRYEYCSQ